VKPSLHRSRIEAFYAKYISDSFFELHIPLRSL
jgi:hypothetical protein